MKELDLGVLQAESTLFRDLLYHIPTAVFVCDADTRRLLYINQKMQELVGGAPNWREKCCYELIKGRSAPCDGCHMCHMEATEQSVQEVKLSCSERRYIMRGRLMDWNGRKVHVEYIEDETERISKEETVLERYHAEELRRLAMSRDVVAQGSANVTRKQILHFDSGGTPGKVLGRETELERLVEEVTANISDETQRLRVRQLLNADRSLDDFRKGAVEESVEYRRGMADGANRWVRMTRRLYEQPGTGDIMAYVYVRDINQWMLRQEMATALIDQDFDYIVSIDGRTGHFLTLPSSRCKVVLPPLRGDNYGESAQRYVRENVPMEQWGGDDPNVKLDHILWNLDHSGDYHVYHDVRCVDGGLVQAEVHYFYLDKENRRILLTSRDISAQNEAEKQRNLALSSALQAAEQASRIKSEFLSRMSHEVRTPMNAIIGLAHLGQEDCEDSAVTAMLQKIEASGRYLLGILNDVLDMAKIENGKMELHPEPYLLDDFVTCLSTVIMPLMEQKRIDFQLLTDDPNMRCVMLDKLRINQVFFNLLSNAAKFTQEGGRVELELQHWGRNGGRIHKRFIVRDNGVGMSPEFLKRVFEPFAQEQSGHTSETAGTGLGLAITRNLVDLMGGTMEIASSPGEGTTVTVDMEVDIVAAPVSEGVTAETWREVLTGRRVLLVEDHPLNRLVATRLLEKQGMETHCAENGQEAVDYFQREAEGWFDAILMDIRMPVMDGLDAARAIRALPRQDAQRIPIIAMTANAFAEDTLLSREAGMNAHLGKPVDPKQLWQTLAEQIEKRS